MKLSEILAEINEKKEVKKCPFCGRIAIHNDMLYYCNECDYQVYEYDFSNRPLEDRYKKIIRGLVKKILDEATSSKTIFSWNINNIEIEVEE